MPPPSPTLPRPRCSQVGHKTLQTPSKQHFWHFCIYNPVRHLLKDLLISDCVFPTSVCIYINKKANTGPNLDRKKIQQLPDHFGPDRPSVVLQQAVQGCIDSAFQQKTVFTLLTQGYGGEKISGVVQRRPLGVAFCLFSSFCYNFTRGGAEKKKL